MNNSRLVRNLIILTAMGYLLGAVAVFAAGEPSACRGTKADTFRAAGDRYRAQQDYLSAARWYMATTRATRGCRSANASRLGAASLADAGTMYATDSYLYALSLVNGPQSPLRLSFVRYARIATDARSAGNPMRHVVSSIDDVTQSMITSATSGYW